MKVVSPVIFGSTGGLQVVRHVLANREGEHQRHAYPERPVQVWIRPYMRYEIVIAAVRYHGPLQSLQDVVRVDVEEFLVILDCPKVVLGHI